MSKNLDRDLTELQREIEGEQKKLNERETELRDIKAKGKDLLQTVAEKKSELQKAELAYNESLTKVNQLERAVRQSQSDLETFRRRLRQVTREVDEAARKGKMKN